MATSDYCLECRKVTSGICTEHSQQYSRNALQGWQCPNCGLCWAFWFKGPCNCIPLGNTVTDTTDVYRFDL